MTPPGIVPGIADRYSWASVLGGYATGLVVEHRDGRPLKIDGNKLHPASLGGTGAIQQAELLGFYDPDRSRGPTFKNRPIAWQGFLAALEAERERMAGDHGAGLRILTGTVTSPTLAAQIRRLLALYPAARWHQWEAVSRDAVRQGAVLAYGKPVEIVPDLRQAGISCWRSTAI